MLFTRHKARLRSGLLPVFAVAALIHPADVPAQSAQIDVGACPGGVPADAVTWDGTGVQQSASNNADRLLLGPDPDLALFDAGDGDDTIFVVDAPAGVQVVGGPGADEIVLCSMSGTDAKIFLGDMLTGASDTDADLLVVAPSVFQNIPEGLNRQLFVFGITGENDRVELQLPPGVEFSGPMHDLRAGDVRIFVLPASPGARLDKSIFRITQASAAPAAPAPVLPPPLSAYDPSLTCAAAQTASSGAETGAWEFDIRGHHAVITHSPERDVFRIEHVPDHVLHDARGGDDVIFMQASHKLIAGAGADQVLVCALDAPDTELLLGPNASATDYDPDTVVIEVGAFQDGIARRLVIAGASSVNDRIILRVPEGMDSADPEISSTSLTAVSGDLTVEVWAPSDRSAAGAAGEMFVVESVAEAAIAATTPAAAPDPRTIVCPEPQTPATFPEEGQTGQLLPDVIFSQDDDRILIDAVPGPLMYDASGGDDLIQLVNARPGRYVIAGHGADIVQICGLDSLSLTVDLGPGKTLADLDADVVIIEAAALSHVPEGGKRLIDVFGFHPDFDRLILRAPAGTEASWKDERSSVIAVSAGDVEISLYRSDQAITEAFNPDSVVIETAGAVPPRDTPPEFPAPRLAADIECAALGGVEFSEPLDARHPHIESRLFGPNDDRILIDAEPGLLVYQDFDGDDLAVVTDIIAGTQLDLGSGADTALLCSMRELAMTIIVGPHDGAPDTVIVMPEIFTTVPEGFTRELTVVGLVETNDRIVLRLPPGMQPVFEQSPIPAAIIGPVKISVLPTEHQLDLGRTDVARLFVAQ